MPTTNTHVLKTINLLTIICCVRKTLSENLSALKNGEEINNLKNSLPNTTLNVGDIVDCFQHDQDVSFTLWASRKEDQKSRDASNWKMDVGENFKVITQHVNIFNPLSTLLEKMNSEKTIHIIFPVDSSQLLEFLNLIHEYLKNALDYESYSSKRLERLQNIFLFILLPNQFNTNQSKNATDKPNFLEILKNLIIYQNSSGTDNQHNFESFSLESKIYFLLPKVEPKPNNSKDGFELWEFYVIKDIQIFRRVDPVSISMHCNNYEKMNDKSSNSKQLCQITAPLGLRRKDFYGVTISALGVCSETYRFECSLMSLNGTNYFQSGSSVRLYKDLQDSLNFTELAVNVSDYLNLEVLKNTSASADARESDAGWLLANEKADMLVSQNVFLSELSTFFTFLQPTYSLGVMTFFCQPHSSRLSLFIKPFQTDVWVAFLVFCGFMCLLNIAFSLILHFSVGERDFPLVLNQVKIIPSASNSGITTLVVHDNEADDEAKYAVIGNKLSNLTVRRPITSIEVSQILPNILNDTFIWCSAMVCQKGCGILAASISMRILFLTGLATTLLFYSAYVAGITSTFSVHFQPIRTFQELEEYNYDFAINRESNSIPGYVQKTFELNNIHKTVARLADSQSLPMIINSRTAFIDYSDSVYGIYLKNHTPEISSDADFCNLITTINVDNTKIRSGIVVPKHSPFREIFNIKIIQMKERGFNFKYMSTYERETRINCPSIEKKVEIFYLDFTDVSLAFFILIGGCLFSIVIIGLEFLTVYGPLSQKSM